MNNLKMYMYDVLKISTTKYINMNTINKKNVPNRC